MAQTPILGRTASGEEVHNFRARKLELKALDYPVKETRAFVQQLFDRVKGKFDGEIDTNTILVKVPSGSGMNKVTVLFSKLLEKHYGAQTLPDGLIARTHMLEAKKNLTLEKRLTDPIGYRIDADKIKDYCKGKKIVIVDDLIGSGESSIKLLKEIESKTMLKVAGLANLITVEKRYATENDFKRVLSKIHLYRPLKRFEQKKLFSETMAVFASYPRQKLNRLEREIRNHLSAVGALSVIARAAAIEPGYVSKFGTLQEVSLGASNNMSMSI